MTVTELIEKLKTMPQDAEVDFWNTDGYEPGDLEVNEVVLTELEEYRRPRVIRLRYE